MLMIPISEGIRTLGAWTAALSLLGVPANTVMPKAQPEVALNVSVQEAAPEGFSLGPISGEFLPQFQALQLEQYAADLSGEPKPPTNPRPNPTALARLQFRSYDPLEMEPEIIFGSMT